MYYFQVRYTEAEPLHLEAINIFREGLGENHPHTQTIMENIKLCCSNSGK
nr:tetratricopeptide repeat protein [Microcystis sp. LEGE 00066]